ncbi:MAG: hypothetical protein KDC52_13055 [Ignavibacteriae bacterium]|nr:hypothetical protein [Ignavibacteriota bacterium]
MKNSLEILAHELFLQQSVQYGQDYVEYEPSNTSTFNDLSIYNLEDWYNNLMIKYNFLNTAQDNYLYSFFDALNYVLLTINPDKLNNIKDGSIEGTDLLIWRESVNGISQLIFDEYGQITYLFNGNDGSKQKGIFEGEIDMQKLLLRFLSK